MLQYPPVEYAHAEHVAALVAPGVAPPSVFEVGMEQRRHVERLQGKMAQAGEKAELNRKRAL